MPVVASMVVVVAVAVAEVKVEGTQVAEVRLAEDVVATAAGRAATARLAVRVATVGHVEEKVAVTRVLAVVKEERRW